MTFKTSHLTILLLGLTLFISTTAAKEECKLKLYSGKDWIYYSGESISSPPFDGWVPTQNGQVPRNISSFKSVEAVGSCQRCYVTPFSNKEYSGKYVQHYFENGLELDLSFCAKSFYFDCSQQEQEEEEVDEEEENDWIEYETVVGPRAYAARMLTLRDIGLPQAIEELQSNGVLAAGEYTSDSTYTLEIPTNTDAKLYRFTVGLYNSKGKSLTIQFVVRDETGQGEPFYLWAELL